MKKLFAYYEIPTTLRLDKQQARPWPEWPHIALANIPANNAAAWKAFKETYGCQQWDAEDAAGWRCVLQAEWERVAKETSQTGQGVRGDLTYTPDTLDLRFAITPQGEIEMVAASLRDFIIAAFWRDAALGRVKICPSPECPNRYFLESKRGQIYCSHRCAVRENVRRFRLEHEKKQRTRKKVKK